VPSTAVKADNLRQGTISNPLGVRGGSKKRNRKTNIRSSEKDKLVLSGGGEKSWGILGDGYDA